MVLDNAEQKLTWFLLTRIESIRVNYHLALISCNKVYSLYSHAEEHNNYYFSKKEDFVGVLRVHTSYNNIHSDTFYNIDGLVAGLHLFKLRQKNPEKTWC